MLQRKEDGTPQPAVHEHGFMIAVEIEEGGPSTDSLINKLADALTFVEGVGRTEVTHMGVFPDEVDTLFEGE